MANTIWGTLDPFLEGGEILGRKVANASFLRALLKSDPFDEYHFFLPGEKACESHKARLSEEFPDISRRNGFKAFDRIEVHQRIAETDYFAFHLSDCLGRQVALARLRNAYSRCLFPISAPTHSLSYQRFMPEYLAHLWPGACNRDVIIATSQSAVDMVGRTFEGLIKAYGLETECGAQATKPVFHRPRVERVPLGINPDDFPSPVERWENGGESALAMRARLELSDEVMFLCVGRISTSSKMDLLPVISGFARAKEQGLGPEKCVLVLAGWVEDGDPLPNVLGAYAKTLGVRLKTILKPSDEERRDLYAAADVFISMSDNLQETFGLTIAEAGISGLPVIASDFDGYRDIAVNGESAFLIPCLGFAESFETNLQAGLWYDNQYHLKLAQQTPIDLNAMAKAVAALGQNRELRRSMGEKGRSRCLELFAWPEVIKRHVSLWSEISQDSVSQEEERRIREAEHPLFMDFAGYFRNHFREVLDEENAARIFFRRTVMGDALYSGKLPPLQYAGLEFMLDKEALRRVLLAARKAVSGQELLAAAVRALPSSVPQKIASERAAFVVLWCMKQGYLEISS